MPQKSKTSLFSILSKFGGGCVISRRQKSENRPFRNRTTVDLLSLVIGVP